MEIALQYSFRFDVLVLLAGTVNAETPSNTKLRMLTVMMERYADSSYADVFKKNLDGLSVQEVHESTCFLFTSQLIPLSQTSNMTILLR